MNRILFISILLFVSCVASKAQEKQWTLDACIQYAVENSPRVNKLKAQNSIYQQDYLGAIGKLIPSLNVGTNAYFNFGLGIYYDTNTYIDINALSNAYSVYSSLTLFDGFANINRIKMQQANKLAGKQQLEQEREMVGGSPAPSKNTEGGTSAFQGSEPDPVPPLFLLRAPPDDIQEALKISTEN